MAPTDRLFATVLIATVFMSTADLIGDGGASLIDDVTTGTTTVEVLAKPGETVVLPCDPNSPTILWRNASVKWYRDNRAVKLGARYSWGRRRGHHNKTFDNSGKHDIHIRHVNRQDSGVWQCRLEGRRKKEDLVSHPIRLIIASMPSHPRITSESEETVYQEASVITVTEGNDMTLKCIVPDADPPVRRIDWLLDKSNVTSHSSIYVRRQDFVDMQPADDQSKGLYRTISVWTMAVTRQHNNKAIHCQPHHPLWTSNSPSVYVVLNVIYKPSFVLTRSPGFGTPIIEGNVVSLHCKINSNPPSLPYWVKDISQVADDAKEHEKSIVMNKDNKYRKDGFLNFTSIQGSDSGWYRCSTDHKMGHFASFGYFLSVKHAPQIVKAPPKTVEAELGDDVLLECGATGSPAPSYCWSRIRGRHRHKHRKNDDGSDGKEKTSKKPVQLESMGLEQNLLLDRLLYSDSGMYMCTASNKIVNRHRHAHSHSVRLNVKGRPTVEPINRTVRVMAGRPASLSVTICANPPPQKLYWIIGKHAVTPDRPLPGYNALKLTETEATNCYMSSLEIDKVSQQDGGEVLVIAKNSKGINDGVIIVNLTTASYAKSQGHSLNSKARIIELFSSLFVIVTCIHRISS